MLKNKDFVKVEVKEKERKEYRKGCPISKEDGCGAEEANFNRPKRLEHAISDFR